MAPIVPGRPPHEVERPDLSQGGKARTRRQGPPRTGRTVTVTIATVNPTTGETLKTFEPYDESEVDRRLALSEQAFRSFRRMGLDERARLVRSLADLLDAEKASLAETMTTEMGKPVVQARAEIAKCANGLRFYADNAPAMLADEPVTTTVAKHGSYV